MSKRTVLMALSLFLIGGLLTSGLLGCRPMQVIVVTATPTPEEELPPPEEPPPGATPESRETPQTAGGADVVFHNGQIITMESALPFVQGIAIQGDKILRVGSDGEVLAHRGPESVVVDLGGATLMPGFIDAHTHVLDNPGSIGGDLHSVQELTLSCGVTTLADAFSTADLVARLIEMDRAGELRIRVSLYLPYNNPCGERLANDWYLAYPQSIDPGAMLQMPGTKVFSDGGSCNAPAVSFEYPSGVGMGDLYYTQEEMNQIVSGLQANGYQVAIHALGDRAIEQALNAIDNALGGHPNTYRHRIEHNAVVRPDLIPRYSEVGAVPILFGSFPTCFRLGETSQFKYAIPEEFKTWEWPWREVIEANPDVIFAWHGDTPTFEFDPIRNLYGFLTRRDFAPDGSLCEPPDWLVANTIPVETALRLMTINSAYALFRDKDIGSLREGKYADLILLSDNPLTMEPNTLIDLEVWLTMVNGKVEYCAPGHENLCP